MMPLIFADKGANVTVRKVGGDPDVRRHLGNLGFVEDSNITVVSENNGNLIVNVKDTRVAISREMAARIVIE